MTDETLRDGSYYVVKFNEQKEVWKFRQIGPEKCWYRPGDEEAVPFEWAEKVIRKVRL